MADIYDEALADRKRLLEVAESNAKNKIVDAITPRIKELVESALLGKLNEELGDDDDILVDIDASDASAPDVGQPIDDPLSPDVIDVMPVGGVEASEPVIPGNELGMGPDDAGLTLPDEQGKITLDVDSFMASNGSDPTGIPTAQFELTPESVRALSALVGTAVMDLDSVNERLEKMDRELTRLVSLDSPSVRDREQARQIRQECQHLYATLQASRDVLDENRVRDTEDHLETIYHDVMEHYSALGHIVAIVRETDAINRRAAQTKSQLSESRLPTGADIERVAQMLRETMDLHSIVRKLHESLGSDDSVDAAAVRQVGANLSTLYTEIRNMVTKKGTRIDEADELDVGADMGADMGADAPPEADAGMDAEQVLVQLKLPASLMDITGGEQVEIVSVEPAPEDDMGDEMGDMGGDDMGGLDDMGLDGDEASDEGLDDELPEGDMYEARLSDDDIIEIDEAALVAEMKKMKQLREKKKVGTAGIKNVNTGGHGPAHFDAFGGGKDEGESFVDGEDLNAFDPAGGSDGYLEESEDVGLDETDLAEADDEESEDLDEGELAEDEGVSGTKIERARQKREMGESRREAVRGNRVAQNKQLAEMKKVRAELAEQKLFNTKLVALNRVLQIPGLKQAQKERVVELLDQSRTVAEVKQTYSRIVESLKKRQSVQESAQRASGGSSSRATTSSAPSSTEESHPLLEKWQKIAFGGSGLIQG